MILSICQKHSIKFFCLILSLISPLSFTLAQILDMLVHIHLKQAGLKEITAQIEKMSGYSFIYGEEVIFKHPKSIEDD